MKETRGRKPGVAKATVTFMLERAVYAELLARVGYGKRSVWIQQAIEAKLREEPPALPRTLIEVFSDEEEASKPLFL